MQGADEEEIGGSIGKEGNVGGMVDPKRPVTSHEKSDGGSGPAARAENRDAGKLLYRELGQSTLASKKRLAETSSPATGLERVSPNNGRVKN